MSTDPNRIYIRLSAEDRRAIAKREKAEKVHINDILRPYAIAWGSGEEPIYTQEQHANLFADYLNQKSKREEVERENHHLREAVTSLKEEGLGRDMKLVKAERHGRRMQTTSAILGAIMVIGAAVITAFSMEPDVQLSAVEPCPPCPEHIPCPVWHTDAQPKYEYRVHGIVDVWMDSTGAWRAFDDGREITVKAWQE